MTAGEFTKSLRQS